MTKYRDPPLVGTGAGPLILECIRWKGAKEKESPLLKGNLFVYQNNRKYNQILKVELNLNDLEKLTTKDEIMMYDKDKNAMNQARGL